MCLSPIRILNKSKYVDIKNGSSMYYTVPCGHCVECRRDAINGLLARASAEHEYTIKNGGFTYVDCLTYDDIMLPILTRDGMIRNANSKYDFEKCYDKGIPCFCKRDVRLFFVRLREYLHQHGFHVLKHYRDLDQNGNEVIKSKYVIPIKHFCAWEYGGQFHRPHYHILFNILIPNITAEQFEKAVEFCWREFGIIDHYKKDGSLKTASDKVVNGNGAIAYISKYCVKQDDFFLWLTKSLVSHFGYNIPADVKPYDLIRFVKKETSFPRELLEFISPRYLISNGYGACIASEIYDYSDMSNIKHTRDYIYMYETGLLKVHSTKDGKSTVSNIIKIPPYIQRKLWYKTVKDPKHNDSVRWELNTEGLNRKLDRTNSTIEFLSTRFNDILNNLPNYVSLDSVKKLQNLCHFDTNNNNDLYYYTNQVKRSILGYLGDRSLSDFAAYCSFYKGRIFMDRQTSIPDIYNLSVKDKQTVSDYSYLDKDLISLSRDDFDSSVFSTFIKLHSHSLPCNIDDQYNYMLDILYKYYTINENSFDEFSNFDKLYRIFEILMNSRNINKEYYLLKEQELKARQKLLDPRYRQHEINNINHRGALLHHIKTL